MRTPPDIPISRQRVLLADFSSALRQQMFFWGRDVMTGGNLLLKHGFERHPSSGLQGTSCYRCRHGEGLIELHGACAGWYPNAESCRPGFLYVRTSGRCVTHHLHEPVVPGRYEAAALHVRTAEVLEASRFFASWLIGYEAWISRQRGPGYRAECRRMLASLPKGRVWLPAPQAERWMHLFVTEGAGAPRARSLVSGRRNSIPPTYSKVP